MKRLLLSLGLVALIGGIGYGIYVSQRPPAAAVTSLLPAGTVAFVHLPDFRRTRDDWRGSDLYSLYREPAVQEFLRNPLANRSGGSWSRRWEQLEQLDPKDVFVAITSVANDETKVVGGFRFNGRQDKARQIIDDWRSNWVGQSAPAETIEHQRHKIDVYRGPLAEFACVYDGAWFFAANDVEELKGILDSADKHATPNTNTLGADKNFRAAMAHLPSSYAFQLYAEPKQFAGSVPSLRDIPVERICAATGFEHGKIHDVVFAAGPKSPSARITRESLSLGSKDTLLYVASRFGLAQSFQSAGSLGVGGFLGDWLQKVRDGLARAHVSPEAWESTFGSEIGVLGDWPQDSHWPWGVAVFPVKDSAQAVSLASSLARAMDEDATWTEAERDGVHYLSMEANGTFIVMRPTIAITAKHLIVGVDPGSVEAAVQRSRAPSSDLAQSATYRQATGEVATPETFFAYVDLALFYRRLDTSMRPMLLLGAAFMPGISSSVDLNKFPPTEAVTKHLSPIVSSQRYTDDGLLLESVGPLTLNQSGIALIALGALSSRSGIGLPGVLPPIAPGPKQQSGGWRGKGVKTPRNAPLPSPPVGGTP